MIKYLEIILLYLLKTINGLYKMEINNSQAEMELGLKYKKAFKTSIMIVFYTLIIMINY